ncbi:MAG: LON peptidase substrate-binding domain-containing protein [Gemmatimonadota bacterium]|nr:MAG: LON peptidase substrate-binding domain-containing protein [Gemmatimonadota bacterium]
MRRLPLFPLPMVLFPGAITSLHVFEPRYRRMMEDAFDSDERFGIIFQDPDRLDAFDTEEGGVGTLVVIEKARPLSDGGSLILVRGKSRFRIVDGIESEAPYFEALVEVYEDDGPSERDALMVRRYDTLQRFNGLVKCLSGACGECPPFDVNRELAFQLAPAIQIDPVWQQSLLELRHESDRLERLDAVLQAALDQQQEDVPAD